jgi:hypothetical protein
MIKFLGLVMAFSLAGLVAAAALKISDWIIDRFKKK